MPDGTDQPRRKGAYIRKDTRRCVKAEERARNHAAGNPEPEIRVSGVDLACDEFFRSRGFKPSISKILQTRGVVIGVRKWVSKRGMQ
jgi:hypothetical protein